MSDDYDELVDSLPQSKKNAVLAHDDEDDSEEMARIFQAEYDSILDWVYDDNR